ncbi:hypothetical protein G6F43_008029 [Rhizopus delemar]|nr:hypothetical protein G6F43_008029 [Rhizopus delemar]
MPTVSRLPQSTTSFVTASPSRWFLSLKPGCSLLLVFQPHGSCFIFMALLLLVNIMVLWVSVPSFFQTRRLEIVKKISDKGIGFVLVNALATRVSLSRSKHSSFAIELETWFRSNETDVTENSYTVASNEWMDGTRPDVVYTVKDKPTAINPHILIEFQDKVSRDFMSRLINYSLFAYHGYKVYPIDLVFVIKGFSSVSVEKEFIVASEKPFLKIESKFWTKECLLLLAKSILGYIGQSPMDPMVAMGYFLTSGAVSLGSLEHQLDPTMKMRLQVDQQ